jgi:transcriptional regulator with XRE-family HTH domain
MPQGVLAEKAGRLAGYKEGLTKSFVSLLESDHTKPSVASLAAIAHVLDVSLDYLVTGQGRRRATPPIKVSVQKKAAHVEERRFSKTRTLTVHHGPQITITVTRPGEDGKRVTRTATVEGEKAAVML